MGKEKMYYEELGYEFDPPFYASISKPIVTNYDQLRAMSVEEGGMSMGVYIKGMEMPTRCCECRLSTCHSFKERPLCDVLVEYMSYGEWEAKRLDNCPLVPVPPHGRLIDADALPYLDIEWEDIVNAPTVIEAEEVKES